MADAVLRLLDLDEGDLSPAVLDALDDAKLALFVVVVEAKRQEQGITMPIDHDAAAAGELANAQARWPEIERMLRRRERRAG